MQSDLFYWSIFTRLLLWNLLRENNYSPSANHLEEVNQKSEELGDFCSYEIFRTQVNVFSKVLVTLQARKGDF